MSPVKAKITQSDLTRGLKAWKAVYETEPLCRIMPDGTMELAPAGAIDPSGGDLTPLQKWKSGNAS